MKRREFLGYGALATIGAAVLPGWACGSPSGAKAALQSKYAKNIIFFVSDGMSNGTMSMADIFLQRKENSTSRWLQLYRDDLAARALVDTSSLNALVTDSAAASSAWSCGYKVNNGSLCFGPDGQEYEPILQTVRNNGKAVGCVTTVPVTHATPAGFCVVQEKRGKQEKIAENYLPLKFDVMMGGGARYFTSEQRQDGKDVLSLFKSESYDIARTASDMKSLTGEKPILALFDKNGLPYSLDHKNSSKLSENIPSLAEMTKKAIEVLSNKPQGFVLQVEGGKVDWAAHANDIGGLIYDQIAFDEAVGVGLDFAMESEDTLVIITTDHGNANPGIFSSEDVNTKFDRIQKFTQTNDWILNGLSNTSSVGEAIDRIEQAQGYRISQEEAKSLLEHYSKLEESENYNPYKLPFAPFADIQENYTSVGWGSMSHSSDFVEMGMYGPGSQFLKPFVKNTDLRSIMLKALAME